MFIVVGHSHQLRCLAKLVVRLKARLEIMHQKRDILALATFSTTEAEKNVEHAGHFCNTNSERSSYVRNNSIRMIH